MIRSIPTAWTYVATSRQIGLRDVKGAEEWPQSSGKSSSTRSPPRWINSCPSYSRRWVVGQFEPGRGKREASRSTLGLPLSVSLFAPRVLIGGVVALEEVRNGGKDCRPRFRAARSCEWAETHPGCSEQHWQIAVTPKPLSTTTSGLIVPTQVFTL